MAEESAAFSETDGIVTMGGAGVRQRVDRILAEHPGMDRWRIEWLVNHQHLGALEPPREMLRLKAAYVVRLGRALRRAYPERVFVITNRLVDDVVGFTQTGEGAPETDTPAGPPPEMAWCQYCGGERPYHLRPEPDPEFPDAEWGECAACGDEVIVRALVKRTVIGRKNRRRGKQDRQGQGAGGRRQ